MHRETVDFGSPNVTPIASRKLPDAKKRKAIQELEQVAKVRDYERCFSQDHRTTNRQGNLWSLYQNGILT